MDTPRRIVVLLVFLVGLIAAPARADEIADWTNILGQAAQIAATSGLNMSRNAAIVQAAVFDAVNGIEGKFTSIHVAPAAPPGASQRAAAIQAAYVSLVNLYPALKTTLLDPQREASLAAIASGAAAQNSVSIARGIAWGQTVADQIWSWRSGDGFSNVLPPLLDGVNPGEWRKTPPAFAPAVGRQFATMTPWVITAAAADAYRPGPPPSLASGAYALDFAEVKSKGEVATLTRTADESLYSLYWNASSAGALWNRIALSISASRHLTFSEESRLLALLAVGMADAAIGCWDAKYKYLFWRPITAIRTDGIPADATWTAFIPTPAHPDYPSGHSCVSGAAGRILSNYFGEDTAFVSTSDAPAMAGVERSFSSFTQATEEIKNARVFAGIHFRTACNVGQLLGINVADYVLGHALLPVNGQKSGQLQR
jgi:hypothetical protein